MDFTVPAEITEVETPAGATAGSSEEKAIPSLEETSARPEHTASQADATGGAPRRHEVKRERANENPLLSHLPADAGETTAMAEAFRAAARQRSKEENEPTEE